MQTSPRVDARRLAPVVALLIALPAPSAWAALCDDLDAARRLVASMAARVAARQEAVQQAKAVLDAAADAWGALVGAPDYKQAQQEWRDAEERRTAASTDSAETSTRLLAVRDDVVNLERAVRTADVDLRTLEDRLNAAKDIRRRVDDTIAADPRFQRILASRRAAEQQIAQDAGAGYVMSAEALAELQRGLGRLEAELAGNVPAGARFTGEAASRLASLQADLAKKEDVLVITDEAARQRDIRALKDQIRVLQSSLTVHVGTLQSILASDDLGVAEQRAADTLTQEQRRTLFDHDSGAAQSAFDAAGRARDLTRQRLEDARRQLQRLEESAARLLAREREASAEANAKMQATQTFHAQERELVLAMDRAADVHDEASDRLRDEQNREREAQRRVSELEQQLGSFGGDVRARVATGRRAGSAALDLANRGDAVGCLGSLRTARAELLVAASLLQENRACLREDDLARQIAGWLDRTEAIACGDARLAPAPRDGTVEVPVVVGVPIDQAMAEVRSAGFAPADYVAPQLPPGKAAAGMVIRQDPNPGTRMAAGQTIRLSHYEKLVTVPAVENKQIDIAVGLVRNARLIPHLDNVPTNDRARINEVVAQSIPAGSQEYPGTIVVLRRLVAAQPAVAPVAPSAPASVPFPSESPAASPPASASDASRAPQTGGSASGPDLGTMFDRQTGSRTTTSTPVESTVAPQTAAPPMGPAEAQGSRVAAQAATAAGLAERDRERTQNAPDWSERLRDGLIGVAQAAGTAQQAAAGSGGSPPSDGGQNGGSARPNAPAPSPADGPRCNSVRMSLACSSDGRSRFFLYRSPAPTITSYVIINSVAAPGRGPSGVTIEQCVAQGVPPGASPLGGFETQAQVDAEFNRLCPVERRTTGF
ncbi:MAG: PASTA domain-containing protein [Vicinamibacterales bacterium]